MSDEYLWDRCGTPDADVQRLEQVLEGLRFAPQPGVVPLRGIDSQPRSVAADAVVSGWARSNAGRWQALKVAVLSAAATMVLIGGWRCLAGRGGEPVELRQVPVAVPASEAAPAVSTGEARIEAEQELDLVGAKGEPTRAPVQDEASAEQLAPVTPKRRARAAGREPQSRESIELEPVEPPSSAPAKTTATAELVAREQGERRPDLEHILTGQPLDPSAPPLRQKPTTKELKDAIARVKEEAMACGSRHGAAPGTRVLIKASVEGKTGVVQATPTGEHEHTALGRCVADVFERIRFAPFEVPRFGFACSMRV